MARYVLYREDGQRVEEGDDIMHRDGTVWIFESIMRLGYGDEVAVEASRADGSVDGTTEFTPSEFNLTVDVDG